MITLTSSYVNEPRNNIVNPLYILARYGYVDVRILLLANNTSVGKHGKMVKRHYSRQQGMVELTY